MPKLADKYSKYKQKTKEYEDEIFGAIGRKRIKQKDVAKAMNRTQATVSNKLKDIDSLTLGELRSLASYLEITITIGE